MDDMKEAIKILEAELKAAKAKWVNSKYLPPTQKSLFKEGELKSAVLTLQKAIERLKKEEK